MASLAELDDFEELLVFERHEREQEMLHAKKGSDGGEEVESAGGEPMASGQASGSCCAVM